MQKKELVNGPFKSAYKNVGKLKGKEKEKAIIELNERMDMYEIAQDFSFYYPKLYTKEMLQAIVNAKTNIEAANIMTTLRNRQGECLA